MSNEYKQLKLYENETFTLSLHFTKQRRTIKIKNQITNPNFSKITAKREKHQINNAKINKKV